MFEGHAEILRSMREADSLTLPVLLCFFTGPPPAYAAAMPRDPSPQLGALFGGTFSAAIQRAMGENPALHDGAVMLGRPTPTEMFRITGWSHRLLPPPVATSTPNMGSAFNSCLAMSAVDGVDFLYLLSRSATFRFEKGQAAMIEECRAVE